MKQKEIFLITCQQCQKQYATEEAPSSGLTSSKHVTECPHCHNEGAGIWDIKGAVTEIPLLKR
jgi:NAD-dependent SIR2 family protein deacetylase